MLELERRNGTSHSRTFLTVYFRSSHDIRLTVERVFCRRSNIFPVSKGRRIKSAEINCSIAHRIILRSGVETFGICIVSERYRSVAIPGGIICGSCGTENYGSKSVVGSDLAFKRRTRLNSKGFRGSHDFDHVVLDNGTVS